METSAIATPLSGLCPFTEPRLRWAEGQKTLREHAGPLRKTSLNEPATPDVAKFCHPHRRPFSRLMRSTTLGPVSGVRGRTGNVPGGAEDAGRFDPSLLHREGAVIRRGPAQMHGPG